MTSVRSKLNNAIDTKRVPPFKPGDLGDLAVKLKLPFPVKLSNLLQTLDSLTPAGVTYDSGPMTANFVHGSAQIYLQSDGLFSFKGGVKEAGAVGDNYIFVVALLDVKDASGKIVTSANSGNVAGTLDFGTDHDEWKIDGGPIQAVTDNWDVVKKTQVQFLLHVSTDPWQVTETVVGALLVAAAIAVGVGVTIVTGAGANVHCNWLDETGTPTRCGKDATQP